MGLLFGLINSISQEIASVTRNQFKPGDCQQWFKIIIITNLAYIGFEKGGQHLIFIQD